MELLPSLHQIAQQNLRQYHSETQKCFDLESICADATAFHFPEQPLVIFLFNPFPESGMRQTILNLEQSLRRCPRAIYVIYHNSLLEHVLSESAMLRKTTGTHQYSIFSNQ